MNKEWKFSKLIFRPVNSEGFPAKYRIIYCKNTDESKSYISIKLYCLIPFDKLNQYMNEGFNPLKTFKDKVLIKTELNIKNLSFLNIFKIGVESKHFDGISIEEVI
jgi:hypothetical protein